MKNILGIDYGKNLGLAIATTPLAEPLKTISLNESFEVIKSLVQEYQIDLIVIGISEGEMAEKTKSFAKNLENNISTPIYFQDETLSSHHTRQKMAKANYKQSKKHQKIDHLVAASILQDYLDEH